MPFTSPFIYLTIHGTMPGEETWSTGLKLLPGNASSISQDLQALADDLEAPVGAWFTAAGTAIDQRVRLTSLKLALVGTDGLYIGQAGPWVADYGTPGLQGGGPASGALPPQVAYAVTLDTAVSRGLAKSGRMFVPLPAWGTGTNGRIQAAEAQAAADSAATLIRAINLQANEFSAGTRVAVMSERGASQVVTGVRVGDVLDTIRSRRASIRENYRATVLPAQGF